MNYTYQDYKNTCKTIASDLRKAHTTEGVTDYNEAFEEVYEASGNCSEVIYTGQAWSVVDVVSNLNQERFYDAEEHAKDLGFFDEVKDTNTLMTHLAFCLINLGVQAYLEQWRTKDAVMADRW
jgi:hypothetical protein